MENLDWTKLENRQKLYQASLENAGAERINRLAQEEAAELIQAINKFWRYPLDPKKKDDLIEEIADVEVMLEQLRLIFDEDEIDKVKAFKCERLWKKMYNQE
jgi:NTP pyrophosphatase (non-canonical NTP hydrolase)